MICCAFYKLCLEDKVYRRGGMPCSCQVPIPDYPANAAWGPILWQILHGFAERAGQGSAFGAGDEAREWQKFIKATGEMLPCEECRDHFVKYTSSNPLTQFTEIPSSLLKTKVKSWFWQIHTDIVTEYNKEVLPYEQLESVYSKVNLQDLYWRLEPVIKQAINVKGMGIMKWMNWKKEFTMLKAILGI